MMIDITIFIILFIISCYFCYKIYKKCEDRFEKVFYLLFVGMQFFIVALYYLDKWNMPTLLHWNENVNTQNWLSIISGFGINILGEILGGVILFFVTIMQINKTLNDNRQRDKEERRINNLPLLQYCFEDEIGNDSNIRVLDTILKDGINDEINLKIKNIGMNAVRKCYVSVNSDILKRDFFFELDQQSCLNKGEEKIIKFLLNLTPEKYKFRFKIYYQDLMFNWYLQNIELNYELTSIFKKIRHFSIKNMKVSDEIQIDELSIQKLLGVGE